MMEMYKELYSNLTSLPSVGELGVDASECLSKYAKLTHAKTMVEIGFNRGSSALAFLLTLPEVILHSVDIRAYEDVKESVDFLTNYFPGRFFYYSTSSENLLDVIKTDVDFVFIDGDHSHAAILRDTLLSIKLNPNYILYDDACHPQHGPDVLNVIDSMGWMNKTIVDCNTNIHGTIASSGFAFVNLT